ncbi:hypothetical protein V4C53_23250 [Paraburkholderia azotifigens]|uniref:hypothetical protein n=1 Tax=Paraburkholderia azotifigens TaxID=2057004 RepID=UPI00317B07EC
MNENQLHSLLASGSLFALNVDGVRHIPALFLDESLNQDRVRALCRRMKRTVPPDAQLDVLTFESVALGRITPLAASATQDGYRRALEVANNYASWWTPASRP